MILRPRGAVAALTLSGLLLIGAGATAGPAQAGTPRGTHLIASASPAEGLGIRLLDHPAAQDGDTRAREYIVQTSAPGTTLTRHLRITNTTGRTRTIQLESTAASIKNGAFTITETKQNALAKWTKVSSTSATIPNGKSITVTVTISIPADATTGEQYAVIWAEMRARGATPNSVTVVNRVGIREYVDVDTTNTAPTFTIDRLKGGRTSHNVPTAVARVTNTGSTAIDLSGKASLSNGPGNTSAGPFPTSGVLTLAPGQHGTITAPTSAALSRGPWTTKLTLHSGSLTHAKSARSTFPAGEHRTTNTHVAGWIVAAGILVALIIAAWIVIVILRRRRRGQTGHSAQD